MESVHIFHGADFLVYSSSYSVVAIVAEDEIHKHMTAFYYLLVSVRSSSPSGIADLYTLTVPLVVAAQHWPASAIRLD